uniref:F-box domain-containing protein n=1 Tax=Setaria italica TaxID=4555 RepID=K4AMQ3_SETIT
MLRIKEIVCLTSQQQDVLSHIVSQLPINDAIRTSVLSRKWKDIWCGHTKLSLNSTTVRKHYFKSPIGYVFLTNMEFVARVDAILLQHSGGGIECMEIKFRLHNSYAYHIDRWVNFAIASKTKELIIDLSGSRNFLPQQLFCAHNGSYLQCLEVASVSLHLPADFKGFLNLKNFTLVDVSIGNEDIQCMLSRCNLLEYFEISYCRNITSIRTPRPLGQLNHLVVDNYLLLQNIELNGSPTTFKYNGTVIPFAFASTSRLTNVSIKFLSCHAALEYIVTGFPSALPRLESLTLHCAERERIILPGRPFQFSYLRHLKLELIIFCDKKIDVLDYALVLEVAPFIEKLELHMWMDCWWCQPYRKEDGELRIRLPHQQQHLKFVHISGFFGYKHQVELALHILRSSVILERMEITPRVEITKRETESRNLYYERTQYISGRKIASEFVCKADQRKVVEL